MENEHFIVNMPDKDKAEVIVREVNVVNELPVKPPVKLGIQGVISAPREFLTKRLDQEDQINQKRCHVLVNRENLSIGLITNEHDDYLKGVVLGHLELHPKYLEFGINQGKKWDPNTLGQFFKMNRAYFADKAANMKLVSDLKGFEAKVDTIIEKHKKENGDFKDNYSGAVTSNLPGTFQLRIPLFKGRKAETIEVEFFASVNGRDIILQLYSPGAAQAVDELGDELIDKEIAAIQLLAPGIAVIEQ